MTAPLYSVEAFYLRFKNYDCKIIFSWTDCKSKLYQQDKIKNICVFLTLTKGTAKKLLPQKYRHKQKRFNMSSH